MGSFKYFFLLLCCISPILDLIFGGIAEGAQYMTQAAIASAVNAVLFGAAYITRDRWSKWIVKEYLRVLGQPKEGEQEPVDSLMIIMMGFDWLVFACLVPYGIYRNEAMDSNWLLLTLFFAAMLWGELYQMRYHLVLCGDAKENVKLSRLPIVTIVFAIWSYFNQQEFESVTKLIVVVVFVLLVEIAIDMAVRVVLKRILKITPSTLNGETGKNTRYEKNTKIKKKGPKNKGSKTRIVKRK